MLLDQTPFRKVDELGNLDKERTQKRIQTYKKVPWPKTQYYLDEGIEPATDDFRNLVNKLLHKNPGLRLQGKKQVFEHSFFADIRDSIDKIMD